MIKLEKCKKNSQKLTISSSAELKVTLLIADIEAADAAGEMPTWLNPKYVE